MYQVVYVWVLEYYHISQELANYTFHPQCTDSQWEVS